MVILYFANQLVLIMLLILYTHVYMIRVKSCFRSLGRLGNLEHDVELMNSLI